MSEQRRQPPNQLHRTREEPPELTAVVTVQLGLGDTMPSHDWHEEAPPKGTSAVSRGEEWYPPRLTHIGKIWVRGGHTNLLRTPAYGLCGSRSASPRGLRWAEFFGQMVARFGGTLVTGMARGVDQTATLSALREGGTAVGVLAEGIASPVKKMFREYVEAGRLTLISEFPPAAGWSVGGAMRRNETICRLGDAMFVIEAGATGGTLAAGRTALKIGVPLHAIAYPRDGEGNDILISEGAHPLRRTSDLIDILRQG